MKLNEIADNPGSRKGRMRVGRGIGSGKGKTAGRGVKGQKSRTGVAIKGFEGGQMPLYRRIPKLKHFELVNQKEFTIINVAKLADCKAGSTISLDSLVKEGLVTSPKHPLKVLGNGELSVKLTVQAAAFTASARTKIEAAGGSCEVI